MLKSLFRGEDAQKKRSLEGRFGQELSAKLIERVGRLNHQKVSGDSFELPTSRVYRALYR